MQSMTGFASKTITITKGTDQKAHISLMLKALNSRYFEVNAKLPPSLSHLETDLIKLFKKNLVRGYVHFVVHVDNPSIFKGNVAPAVSTVKSYMKAIKKMCEAAKIEDDLSVDALVRLPNVFSIEEQGLDKQTATTITKACSSLVTHVIADRKKEGAQLKKDLENRLTVMKKEIAAINKRFLTHMDEKKKKLNALMSELEGDESDLACARKSALYAVLDKIDIHEEIVRFESHLDNLSKLLNAKSLEIGKRIDFTLQELAREINTITAKCSDSEISSKAINIKVDIEKAREQAQNVV